MYFIHICRISTYKDLTHQSLVPPDEELDVVGQDGAPLSVLGERLKVSPVLDQLQRENL